MALIDFFNHKCDIYHIEHTSEAIGFGFSENDNSYSYSDTPDIQGIMCHFHTKSNSVVMNQTEPANSLNITRKLALPLGTDIRINDKVVDVATGVEYTAEMPVNVRNHHIIVTLIRTTNQKLL